MPWLFPSFLLSASGQCYTFGSNQHGQLGTNSCHHSRVPRLVEGLQAMKVTVVACGDAFTVAIGAGEAGGPAGLGASSSGELGGLSVASSACSTVSVFTADGEVCTWGKGARGRLGRKDEDTGVPRPVQLEETHPYVVTSVACCHGNTLLAVKRE